MALWLRRLSTFLLAAILGWAATIWLTPRVILSVAHNRMADVTGGVNHIGHMPPVTPHNQTIVRPAPDLLYSACAYDLSYGPVTLTVGATEGYWSASFFDAATNNFATVNSYDFGQDRTEFHLDTHPGVNDDTKIISPTRKGVILIRRRIASAEQLVGQRAAQAGDACKALGS